MLSTRVSPTAVPSRRRSRSPETGARKVAPETRPGQAERSATTAGAAMLCWVQHPILLVPLPTVSVQNAVLSRQHRNVKQARCMLFSPSTNPTRVFLKLMAVFLLNFIFSDK